MRCPICQTELDTVEDQRFKPLCSARCRAVDLAKWLGGEYAIAGRTVDVDSDAPLIHADDLEELEGLEGLDRE